MPRSCFAIYISVSAAEVRVAGSTVAMGRVHDASYGAGRPDNCWENSQTRSCEKKGCPKRLHYSTTHSMLVQ